MAFDVVNCATKWWVFVGLRAVAADHTRFINYDRRKD
jgi:hypothetical protein